LSALWLGIIATTASTSPTSSITAAAPSRVPEVASLPGVVCTLPVRTDQGPGLLTFPSGAFSASGLNAATGRAFDAHAKRWLGTEPRYIDAANGEAAFLDTAKSGKMTLSLRDASGRQLFTRDLVRSVVGWVHGNLYVTTTNPDRLLKISGDGQAADFVDTPYAGDTWYIASNDALWGIAPAADPAQKGYLSVVQFDVRSNAVTPWYTLQPDSAGLTRAAIIGADTFGRPILADLSATTRAGVYIVSAPGHVRTIYLADKFAQASLRRPMDALSDGTGTWVTTVDGKLIRVDSAGTLMQVAPAGGMHIYDFGGSCN